MIAHSNEPPEQRETIRRTPAGRRDVACRPAANARRRPGGPARGAGRAVEPAEHPPPAPQRAPGRRAAERRRAGRARVTPGAERRARRSRSARPRRGGRPNPTRARTAAKRQTRRPGPAPAPTAKPRVAPKPAEPPVPRQGFEAEETIELGRRCSRRAAASWRPRWWSSSASSPRLGSGRRARAAGRAHAAVRRLRAPQPEGPRQA